MTELTDFQRIVHEPSLRSRDSEIRRLKREVERLRSTDCRTCGGIGVTDGFLLGTVKKCPACNGRGTRG